MLNRPPGQAPANPYAARSVRGVLAGVSAAQRAQTEAQRRAGIGLVVEGSAKLAGSSGARLLKEQRPYAGRASQYDPAADEQNV